MSGAQTAAIPQHPAAPSLLRDFLTLTKPKVQSLLLLTTVTTMYVAGDPSIGLVFLTCLGGALSAGGGGGGTHPGDPRPGPQKGRHRHPPVRGRRGLPDRRDRLRRIARTRLLHAPGAHRQPAGCDALDLGAVRL